MPSVSDTLTKVWGTHTLQNRLLLRMDPERSAGEQQHKRLHAVHSVDRMPPSLRQCVCRHADRQHVAATRKRTSIASTTSRTTRTRGSSRIPGRVTPRLTLELGLRMTHFTPWADDEGFGYSIFNRSQYQHATAQRRLRSADSSGTAADASRSARRIPDRERCSGSRASAWLTTSPAKATQFSAADGADSTITPASSQAGLDTSAGSESVTLSPTNMGNQAAAGE